MYKILSFLCLCFIHILGKVTDEEYASMPPVFHMDDFDRCFLLGQKTLYCTVKVELFPLNSNHSKHWKVIEEVSSSKRHFRHDWLRHGICFPQFCPNFSVNITNYKKDNELLKTMISNCYTEKYKEMGIKGVVTQLHCETQEPFYPVDKYDIAVGLCFFVLLTLIVIGTFREGLARYKTKEEYERKTGSKFGIFMSCFALQRNWERLGSKNTDPNTVCLTNINGIRFYNMLMVVMVHTCMVAFASSVTNPQFMENMIDDPANMIIINGNFAIQTFLLISGWLLSYHFFQMMDKNKKVRFSYVLLAFVNRYVRLTTCLITIIAINGSWLYHINRGPLWDKIVGNEYRNCRKNWWVNLLYINNYYDVEHMCLQQAWYLAADTQLFVFSLIVLTFIWKYKKPKVVFGACLVAAITITGLCNYINGYDILLREYPEPLYEILLNVPEWTVMYVASHTNSGGYIIGLIFGYAFYKHRDTKIFDSKFRIFLWWIITFVLPLSIIFMGYPMYQESFEYTRLGAAVYVALSRIIFAFGIAVGIFGILTGTGWFLRDCVAWAPLQILGRLTYCVYLVHVALIRVRTGQMRTPIYMSSYTFFIQTFGDLILSYMFAIILCLCVEMPTSALQKLMIPQLEKKRNSVSDEQISINGDVQTSKV